MGRSTAYDNFFITVVALVGRLANMYVLEPVCKTCRWGTPYAELNLADRKWSDDELIDFMLAHPILIQRTPYSCRPYGEDRYPSRLASEWLMRDGYIFVCQDVRGRWMSEEVPSSLPEGQSIAIPARVRSVSGISTAARMRFAFRRAAIACGVGSE